MKTDRNFMGELACVILHITSVHHRADTRIDVKEMSVAEAVCPGRAWLVVADGQGDSTDSGRRILDIGRPPGVRGGRALVGSWRLLRCIRRLRPAAVHFHDPELIPLGLGIKLLGYKVIYDVHEDVPRQILTKHWLPAWLRRPVAWITNMFEWAAGRAFDAVVAATPRIAERFPARKTVVIQNFPLPLELDTHVPVPYGERPSAFGYVGVISNIRGAREMVRALEYMDSSVCLELAGRFETEALENELRALPAWNRVRFHGWASRPQVATLLGGVRAGLVVLHPTQSHADAWPVKLFEYMAAGLPVIASDFPLWREIIEGAGCGLLADPLDPEVIAGAMQWILDHPGEAEAMGRRGRRAVVERYNWGAESEKLVALYKSMILNERLTSHDLK